MARRLGEDIWFLASLVAILLKAGITHAYEPLPRRRCGFTSVYAGTLKNRMGTSRLMQKRFVHPDENTIEGFNRRRPECSSGDHHEGRRDSSLRNICVMDDSSCSEFMDIVEALTAKTSLPLYSQTRDKPEQFSSCLRVIAHEETSTYAVAIDRVVECRSEKERRNKRRSRRVQKPFFVDFAPPGSSALEKRKRGQSGADLLVKSVVPARGGGRSECSIVYDLTAGFGQDSVVIAGAGGASSVHMVERDPVIGVLLEDALRRLRLIAHSENKNEAYSQRALELSRKLSFELAEGIEVAKNISHHDSSSGSFSQRPDICYLDPMFPPRSKSAAVKKNMQVLHELLDSQNTATSQLSESGNVQLLEAAYDAARLRVVVKRPLNAKPLGGRLKKSYDIRGSVNRWDIYVKA